MAARSFFVTVINNTSVTWANPNFSLAHGIWSQNDGEVPPSRGSRGSGTISNV
jgi:hypothetical protein